MQRSFGALLAAGALATAGCQQNASLGGALATGEPIVTSIAVDDNFVYWTRADGTVKSVSLGAGVTSTLGQQPGIMIGNLVQDDANLYWSVDSSLVTVPKAGGALHVYPQTQAIQSLSLDGSNLYWTTTNENGTVNQAAKSDFSAQILTTSDDLGPIMAGTATVYWGGSEPTSDASLFNVPVGGGVVNSVLPGGNTVRALSQDTDHIYWGGGDGSINSMAHDASNPQVLASVQLPPSTLITDSSNVYWSNAGGQVQAVSIWGGNPELIVQGTASLGSRGCAVSLTMDYDYIYWANGCDDGIFAMIKR